MREYYNPIREYGSTYGLLRVLNVAQMGTGKLHCRCACGKLVIVPKHRLTGGKVKCCAWRNHPELKRPPRSDAVWVEVEGARMTLQDACAGLGIDYKAARRRYGVGGDPLTEPPRKPPGRKPAVVSGSLRQLCQESGIPYGIALSRLQDGWTPQEAAWIPRDIEERRDDSERDPLAFTWREYYAQG